jgi:hypothetical protein
MGDPRDDAELPWDLIVVANGTITTHPMSACAGEICCVHNPSAHSMLAWPQLWRDDRMLMERLCPHGIGHPDPDDISYKRRTRGEEFAYYEGIHGCDGCCRPPGGKRFDDD